MVAWQKLLRSFTREPDERSATDLRVIPLSDTPWVGPPQFDLAKDDAERLERIAPMPRMDTSSTASLHGRTLSDAPLIHSYPPSEKEATAFQRPFFVPNAQLQGLDAVAVRQQLDEHIEEEENGPPSWLGMFFDLAWTTTFSSLSSNTQLTTLDTLFSYVIFFVLAWWLWAAQVAYDTKYYTNDWFHRIMLGAQLTIFGSLSAFTQNFDPFSKHVDPTKSRLEDFVADQYSRKSMLGISALFAAARLLLVISYVRVLVYLPKNVPGAQQQRPRLLIRIGVSALSMLLFGAAFLVVKFDLSQTSIWIKVILWLGGVFAEIIEYLVVPDVDGRLLLNVDTMGERLSGLTTIILGEGVNAAAGALVQAASAIGFNAQVGGVAASVTLLCLLGFLLYFDGFKRRTLATKNRSKANVLLHFPLHLAIIVLLEAVRNTLTVQSLRGQFNSFIRRGMTLKPGETDTDAVIAAFRNVGIDFNQTITDGVVRIRAADPKATPEEVFEEVFSKTIAQVFFNILSTFNLVDDPDVKSNFTTYLDTIGGVARQDNLTAGTTDEDFWKAFSLTPTINGVFATIQASDVWIPITGAAFLACLGILGIVNEWVPRHRYIWASVLSRWTMATLLLTTSLFWFNKSIWTVLENLGLLGAIVAIAFIIQFGLDQVLIGVAVRRSMYWRRVGSRSGSVSS